MQSKILFRKFANSSNLLRFYNSIRQEMRMELRSPPIRYVMLFPGRTGSTYVTDHMACHPEIVAHYEILSRYQESWEQQLEFLNGMVNRQRIPQIKAVGFKTKLRSILDLGSFESFAKQNQFRLIHLSRRNELKFVVSIVRAKLLRAQNGDSNLTKQDHEPLGSTIIPLADFAKAKTRLRRTNRISQLIDRLGLPKLEIAYEEILENESHTLSKIWDFLGVRRIATTGRTRKNTPHDLRDAVSNLDEILTHHPDMVRYVDQL